MTHETIIYRGVLWVIKFLFHTQILIITMSLMKEMLWSKFKLPFRKEGRSGKEDDMNSLARRPNLNEEYKEVFRTKSYIEICNKVKGQFETKTITSEGQSSFSSPPPPPLRNVHLSNYLLEPHQETLTSMLENPNLQIFTDYFEISLKACKICELLLGNIHQVRINYHAIRSMIKQIKRIPYGSSWTDDEYIQVYKVLASFASQKNTFSTINSEEFRELHQSQGILYQELTSQCKGTKKTIKSKRRIKMVKAAFQMMGCGALATAVLVLAMHSMMGMVAAPVIIICLLGLFIIKKMKPRSEQTHFERVFAQLDVAARGVYTLINDFDTINGLVKIVHDEMDRMKFLADNCVKKGKNEMLKEVAKEFQMQGSCLWEQLEELEKHTYLGFLNINRSRRLVVLEMNGARADPSI